MKLAPSPGLLSTRIDPPWASMTRWQKAEGMKGQGVLKKPIDIDALLEMVKRYCC